MNKYLPKQVQDAGVIFCSHSGGADSMALLSYLKRMGLLHKVVIVHADLGRMEWETMQPWIESNGFGLDCNVVESEEDFFQMVRRWGRFPSGNQQFCTDFLKTAPIEKFIHQYMTDNNITHAINATGMRAEESKRRAKKADKFYSHGVPVLKSDMQRPRKHKDHLIDDWMPIFYYLNGEVRDEIKQAGQVLHKIYSEGFSRLSCVLCINGRIGEHKLAAQMRPELAKEMAELEREVGKSYRLKQVNKIKYNRFMDEYIFTPLSKIELKKLGK